MQTLNLLRYSPENRFTGTYLKNSSKRSTKLGASLMTEAQPASERSFFLIYVMDKFQNNSAVSVRFTSVEKACVFLFLNDLRQYIPEMYMDMPVAFQYLSSYLSASLLS